ncbi:MAG: PPOX class F420-dependent oxidoreductase [Actinobacteria bacterium]|nr:PPOX class F420-dependent oxidoreductase [Actinomycetota bacterium]
MDDGVQRFLDGNHGAIMTTLKKDGTPHVARVGVGLVEGRLWSSGTQKRVRTAHIRRDPRATLCVLSERSPWEWLGLETTVTILNGPEAVEQNLALYRALAGEPEDLDEYRRAMAAEERLIYEFAIRKAYGMYESH